jgi:hypothetical protein
VPRPVQRGKAQGLETSILGSVVGRP